MSTTKKNKSPKIKIDNFTIHRAMGESYDWKKLDIKKKQVEALNEIGHSGKYKGKKTTIQDYFDKYIDSKNLKHEITSMKSNNMEFTDTLLVTRVTLN
jgi:hypothetical protein